MKTADSSFRFLIELYLYHNLVSKNVGIGFKSNRSTHSLLPTLEVLAFSSQLPNGFMFGYAYELYKFIPQISELAFEQHSKNGIDNSANFETVRMKIQQWRPPVIPISDRVSLKIASLLYQQALLIYILCAQHGPSKANSRLFFQVEPHLDQFMELMRILPSDCTEWTTLTWPTMVAGSCLRDHPTARVHGSYYVLHDSTYVCYPEHIDDYEVGMG